MAQARKRQNLNAKLGPKQIHVEGCWASSKNERRDLQEGIQGEQNPLAGPGKEEEVEAQRDPELQKNPRTSNRTKSHPREDQKTPELAGPPEDPKETTDQNPPLSYSQGFFRN